MTVRSKQSSMTDPQGRLSALEVGTAPVNWNNDDLPQWRRHVPLAEMLDAMTRAGYSGTEYGTGFPRDPGELRAELEPRSLKLTGSYQWLHFQHATVFALELTELDNVFRALAGFDCANLIVASAMTPERIAIAGRVPDDGSSGLPERGWATLAEALARVRDRAAAWDIRVHFHNHVGSHVESPPEVERLLEELPDGVDLCFDTGHYAFGGGEPLRFVQQHADRIGYVHLKDVDQTVVNEARSEEFGFLNALRRFVFTELGNGGVDIPAVIAALRDSRYGGWIIVEQDTCKGDPTETAKQNRAYLRSTCGI
ncbi:MAG: TIM barrel protein [Thermomicrobiales bacterium]